MGWNVFGFMVNILFFKKIKRNLSLILVCAVLSLPSFAQESPKAGEQLRGEQPGNNNKQQPPVFKPIHKFPEGISNNYSLSDTTSVVRLMSDSSVFKYERIVNYYIRLFAANKPEKGFQKVEVNVDSIDYYYKEGKIEIRWNSQDEKSGGINFEDLKAVSVPLSKYFDMTYTPYGEVAKIEGEKLDDYYSLLNKMSKGIKDSVEKFIWYDGASFNRLAHLSDMRKFKFPDNFVEIEREWTSPFNIQFENITFIDTITAKIIKNEENYLVVKGISQNLKAMPGSYRFNGIKSFLFPVEKTSGGGTHTILVNKRGTVKSVQSDFDIEVTVNVNGDRFTEKIKSKYFWYLINQTKP